MSEVANDNVDASDKIARWTLRGVYAAADKKSKHDPMGEDGLRYLEPPSPGVYYLMVEFNMTRSMAEWIANIT